MQTFFFTGFPGFLGSELIQNLLSRSDESRAVCLIQSKFRSQAEQTRQRIIQRHPRLKDRIECLEGDITLPDLGIGHFDRSSITQFFHLAAVYDLGVRKEIAQKINVEGTIHTLRFAETLPNLRRYQYVSTCYVSGRHAGVFRETDLDVGQSFNNHYEETKFLAELEVRKAMGRGLPVTIYRPAIVVGNSVTGETQKFDGPYFVIQWLLRQPESFAVLPRIGNPDRHSLNVVPSDFVIQAMSELSQQAASLGQTFHLADPNPPTIRELVQLLGTFTGRKIYSIPLPLSIAKMALRIIPGLERFLRIPPDALNYFVHPTRYETRLTQEALTKSSIIIPHFRDYGKNLVQFMRDHPSLRTRPMI